MTHGPLRTCVACRQVREKGRLVRLVRLAEGTVVVDAMRRRPGRGAYVCGDPRCVERLVKGERLSQAFRQPCRVDVGLAAAVGVAVGSTRDERCDGAIDVTGSVNVMSGR